MPRTTRGPAAAGRRAGSAIRDLSSTAPTAASPRVHDSAAIAALRRGVSERGLILVAAAAGWGKTTAAATALRGRPVHWLQLGPEDDPRRLAARLMAAATSTSAPGSSTTSEQAPTAAHRDASPAVTPTPPPTGRPTPPPTDATVAATLDPVGLASTIARAFDAVSDADTPPPVVVLDDTHRVGDASRSLLRALASTDRRWPLVVLAQHDLALIDERRRVRGDVLEIGATLLALDLDTVDAWIAEELDADRALAARIVGVTGGWPALVATLVDALGPVDPGERSARLHRLLDPDQVAGRFLERVVLAEEPEQHRAALTIHALAPAIRAEQLGALLELDRRGAEGLNADLRARGLLLPGPLDARDNTPIGAVSRVVRAAPRTGPRPDLADRLVDRLIADGAVSVALETLGRLDRPTRAATLLTDHGEQLVRQGHLRLVLDSAATLPPDARTTTIEATRAEALAFRGDWAGALRAFQAGGYGPEDRLPADAAILLGLIEYVRGDLDAALHAYDRLIDDPPDEPALAALHSWRTTVHWLRGEHDDARHGAHESLRIATSLGDDRSMAFAHTAMALIAVVDGDRHANRAHYELALDAARRAGDRLQETRILTNIGSAAGEEGRYGEAIDITEEAIDLAEDQGFRAILGVARCNRSAYLLRTGAIDEAIADAERAREVFAAIGSRTIAYAYHLLGTARTERGDTVLAVQAYDQAIASAGTAGDQQALIPSQLGIARAVATSDLDRAEAAATRAVELDDGGLASGEVHATAAWIALAAGDADRARTHATTALEMARRHSNPADLAEATTLLALLDEDPRPGLEQARSLWASLDAPIWVARVDLAIARRGRHAADQARRSALERRLTALGCMLDRGSVAHVLTLGSVTRRGVTIRTLGSFGVEVDGRAVPTSEWGSRKARELVKVLAARSGWRASREELGHLLWPDEPYERISNRLSVALSVVRNLCRVADATALRTTGSTVALDPDHVEVDAATFARLADQGLRAARGGRTDEAVALLLQAEERYGGDLLEDEPELRWADDHRAELRATYLAVTRTLAELVAEDDPDLAIRLLLRLLDRDGYDEPAHLNLCLALLRAGRHGEAGRRYRLYRDRMTELDLPAVPFAQLQLETRRPGVRPGSEAVG